MSLLPAFDVSEYQGRNLGVLTKYRLGITRASWDTTADATYSSHIGQIVIPTRTGGAYHAGYADHPGDAQAAFFLAQLAQWKPQPAILAIDTREFGMTPVMCQAFIDYCHAKDPLKRPILHYDSEGNWQSNIKADGNWVANTSRIPSIPFVVWQNSNHDGPAGGDGDMVDVTGMDALLGGTVARKAPLWTKDPAINDEVEVPAGKTIYCLDGRTPYNSSIPKTTVFQRVGLAPGWSMIFDGQTYSAVMDRDLSKGN